MTAKLYFSDDFSDEEKTIFTATMESNMEILKINNMDFNIELRKENMHHDRYGYMTPLSDTNDHFGIALNSKTDIRLHILTLGHELIHVEQHLRRKLIVTEIGLIWKDNFIPDFIATDMAYYRYLPWEIEAHKYDKRLFSIAIEKVNV